MKPCFAKEPWKHPAVWKCHMVKKTSGNVEGVAITTAECECRWIITTRMTYAGHLSETAAINEHWRSVIADAEILAA